MVAEARQISVDERILDMDEVAHAILVAEGDLALTAERLLGNKNLQDKLLEALTANQGSLNAFAAKARAFATIKSLSVLAILHAHVMDQAHTLSAADAGKMFIRMAEVVESLSKPLPIPGGESNANEDLIRRMPLPLQRHLKVLMGGGGVGIETNEMIDITPEPISAAGGD